MLSSLGFGGHGCMHMYTRQRLVGHFVSRFVQSVSDSDMSLFQQGMLAMMGASVCSCVWHCCITQAAGAAAYPCDVSLIRCRCNMAQRVMWYLLQHRSLCTVTLSQKAELLSKHTIGSEQAHNWSQPACVTLAMHSMPVP